MNKPVDVINELVVAVKKTEAISNKTESDTSSAHTPRQRASKSLEPMTKEEQLIAINQIIKRLLLDEMTQGTALKELRVNVLGLRQDAYTQLTGVSRKTLSEIENDKGNYTAEIINKVFKPFDLKVGLVPTSSQLLAAILTN
ncbi:transcriptional regulator [Marinomonas sp. CT5]|nr:transcriptional regulator [Marinomonas sp. CT5]